MNKYIQHIQKEIEPLRQEIINHKVYQIIESADELKVFMQYHVYAVWDFMSLLKSLQNNLTCTYVPWFPTGDAETRFLINEIVTGEESDVDENGKRISHFELYLEAMKQCGASTKSINNFTESLKQNNVLSTAFEKGSTPDAAKRFVEFTFNIIGSRKTHLQAAIFTFGREDLIPGMFMNLVKDIHKQFPDNVSTFKYYLERHIEVDGDHHSILALRMMENLCGDKEKYWEEALAAIKESLNRRIDLWNGVYERIMVKRSNAIPVM